MAKPTIHFAHANGFPFDCYGAFINQLEINFKVIGKSMLAHDPRFPIQDGWNASADEIIEYIERSAAEKVIGVGHSFGGTITLKAATKRPDLFERIILLDPVIVVGLFPTRVTRLLKKFGKIGMVTPADKTAGRKRAWHSREEARAYFKDKVLFKDFTNESLDLYVNRGLVEYDGMFHLAFDVPTEVKIYKCIPTDLDRLAKRPLKVPGMIIRGATTDVAYKPFVNRIAKQHNMNVATITGGHMFPFEVPEQSAKMIFSEALQIDI